MNQAKINKRIQEAKNAPRTKRLDFGSTSSLMTTTSAAPVAARRSFIKSAPVVTFPSSPTSTRLAFSNHRPKKWAKYR